MNYGTRAEVVSVCPQEQSSNIIAFGNGHSGVESIS